MTTTDHPTIPAATPTDELEGNRLHLFMLQIVVFLGGTVFMAFEMVGSRVLAPFFGSSIFVWGSLIGIFLGALSTGYLLGGKLSDIRPSTTMLAGILAASAFLIGLVVPLAEPVQSWVVETSAGPRMAPLIASIILFAPASVLMGMVSPFSVRLAATSIQSVGSTAGRMYGISTIGSIVGTLLASFWLIPNWGTFIIISALSLALGVTALIASLTDRHPGALFAAFVAILFGLVYFSSAAGVDDEFAIAGENWSPTFREGGFTSDVEVSEDSSVDLVDAIPSQYHNIAVIDVDPLAEDLAVSPEAETIRLMKFDNSYQAAAVIKENGEVDPTASSAKFRYMAAMEVMNAYRDDIDSALFIGLGSGSLPMRFQEFYPDAEIDVVEIDPKVVDAARDYFGFDDSNMDVHVSDGRTWLAAQDREWDAIIIDAYFADSIPFHLTTQEYMQIVDEHLADNGIVAANIIGAPEGQRSNLFRSMYRTYSSEFSEIAIHPVQERTFDGEYDPYATGHDLADEFQNITLIAANSSLGGYGEVIDRADDLVEAGYDPRIATYARNRYSAPLQLDDVPLLTDEFAPVDALLNIYDS